MPKSVGLLALVLVCCAALFGVGSPGANHAAAATGNTAVLAAVGDMACDSSDPRFRGGAGTTTACAEARLSDRVAADASVQGILGLGDFQYVCGDLADYQVSYNPTWGRLDPLIRPVAGNHEYQTGPDGRGGTCPATNTTAKNYFDHFGAAAHPSTVGHFSFDLGAWHLVALNGNCGRSGVGGCGATSPQTTWLKQDLAATAQPCIAAFWHQPLFTAYQGANASAYKPWWDALYAKRADLVINGHVHNYQRYVPLSPAGKADPANGITELIVGTGGEDLFDRDTSLQPQPTVFLKTFGYARLTLAEAGWTSEFVNSAGQVLDTAAGTCHS